MMNFWLKTVMLCGMVFWSSLCSAQAQECQTVKRGNPVNLTVPVTLTLPMKTATAPVGTVLFKKEASLAQFTGVHKPITGACIEKIHQQLAGRISASQSGQNVFATKLPGLGLRITVIYDKPGATHKEWILPFTASLDDKAWENLTTDDIKLRLEAVKTGTITSGILTFTLPTLAQTTDNSLVVNLALTIIPAQAHCAIMVPNPQVELAPIDVKDLIADRNVEQTPVSVNLQCLNTQKASINIEGVYAENRLSVFKNMVSDQPAQGVGIEMLYNGIVMMPGRPIDITLAQQQTGFALPLTVRYARSGEKITEGKVKAQITLHINYL
ncbi:fimbrial protein [Atlantibacter sp.]|uniref:fimbrial protein n=1 Tax=Atlantibacter sp. TaxID=1903473 RepID=UPI0028AFABBE|nr:fimbrial protein [Atlantibacter sp.]